MVQYWWVNQTDMHEVERYKGIVAARISESGITHWGRENVSKMNAGDFIICYRSKIGIDRAACVIKKCGICPAPWNYTDDKGKAYIAKVKYFIINPIPKSEFLSEIQGCASHPKGPIIPNGNIRYAYAMKLEKDEFDVITEIVKKSQPNAEWPSNGLKEDKISIPGPTISAHCVEIAD
ncbi:MAG: hypothetical protein NTU95_07175 [Methanothrix sp.]|nr:hypothetical protein [Methanothrix sp.]